MKDDVAQVCLSFSHWNSFARKNANKEMNKSSRNQVLFHDDYFPPHLLGK